MPHFFVASLQRKCFVWRKGLIVIIGDIPTVITDNHLQYDHLV
jgi:hypothetical protein